MHCSLATCRDFPDLSTSDSLLADELHRRGHEAEAFVWNGDSPPTLPETDVVVLRSTWDFHHQFDDYVACSPELGDGKALWEASFQHATRFIAKWDEKRRRMRHPDA